MTGRDEPWLRAVAEPGHRPKRRKGMSATAQSIYDVLYEAGEPLDADTIVARTWERSTSAAQGHALRKAREQRVTERRTAARKRGEDLPSTEEISARDVSPRQAWARRIGNLLRWRVKQGTLLRDERGCYSPNPEHVPQAERVDGSTYPYSRKAWLETTQAARTTGEVHTMTMEVERYLGGRSRDELLLVLEVFVDGLAGFGKDKRRPLDPRTVRSQLRWLLERPTTDESRAWLLHELTRRIYET